MKVLSLFSGVGGFDMGLEAAGFETIFQCEWDKHANTILHKHWPAVPKWEDVSTLTGKHILANAPVIDVVAWGSPCQDLSVAGKRAGLEGGRSNLFHEGIRIIKELREETNGQYPRISIWENVVGALNSNKGADFGIIIDEMAEAGAMVIEWAVLDAQYFGVPQRRRRVFVVAIFDPAIANICPDPLLPVSESLPGHLAKGKPKRQSASRTLTEGTGTDGSIVNAIGASIYHKSTVVNQDVNSGHLMVEHEVVGALAARDYKGVGNQYVQENKCVVETFTKSRRAQPATDDETWVEGKPAPTLNAFDQGDVRATTVIVGGNNVPMVAFSHTQGLDAQPSESAWPTLRKEGNGHAVAFQYDGYNQTVNTSDVSQSLRIGRDSSDFVAQPSEPTTMVVRRLTPLECERLMGWPDDHTRHKADGTEQADTHRYKQCGNGVASPVAQWIGKHLIKLGQQ